MIGYLYGVTCTLLGVWLGSKLTSGAGLSRSDFEAARLRPIVSIEPPTTADISACGDA